MQPETVATTDGSMPEVVVESMILPAADKPSLEARVADLEHLVQSLQAMGSPPVKYVLFIPDTGTCRVIPSDDLEKLKAAMANEKKVLDRDHGSSKGLWIGRGQVEALGDS